MKPSRLARFLILTALFLLGVTSWAGGASELALKDLDGRAHYPLKAESKSGSILIFFWQDCPISNGYAPEINRLVARYTNFAFYVVQVDPELSVAAAQEHARKFGLTAPVLLDPKHELVKAVNAAVTPECVVVGKKGENLYRGRIDNQYVKIGKKRATVTEHDLRDALEAIGAGKPVKKAKTEAIGCVIQ